MQYGFTANSARGMATGPGTLIKNYGLAGQAVIGATSGGTAFNISPQQRSVKVDAPSQNIKGFKKWQDAAPMVKASLIELTSDTLLNIIPGLQILSGTNITAVINSEFVGTGDGTATVFNLNRANVVNGSLKLYVANNATSDPVLQTSGYSVNWGTGAITFTTAPASGKLITASYSYDTGVVSNHTKHVVDEIDDNDYLENIALVYEHGTYNNPGVILLRNALGSIDGDVSLKDKEEGIVQITFSAHFLPADLEAWGLGTKTLAEIYPAEWWIPNS